MSMHINEDRESQLLLVGLEKRVMRYRLAAPLGLKFLLKAQKMATHLNLGE
jgi:hypothetical protein